MGGTDGSNDTLGTFLAAAEPLSNDERRAIVDQALVLIDQLYVHLPLKRAMHAVDPAQRLRLLRRRLEGLPDDRRFHDELINIFISLRDLHTNYVLPQPYQGAIAVLPFRIEEYWDGGERRYVVSGVVPGFDEPPFGFGVDVTHWNGMPIHRAVELNADRNGGSNLDARHARGLISMTQRPMALLAAPDEEWVRLTFVAGGKTHEAHFDWRIVTPPPAPTGVEATEGDERLAMALGIDLLTETVRRAQKSVLAPEKIDLERAMAAGDATPDVAAVSTLPDVLEFRSVPAADGRELGYLRIRTFNVGHVDAFVDEVVRILDLLPQDGLIVDVRGNPGGIIMAGERLLQLFTPRPIEPERLHFINTPLTLDLTRIQGLEQWHPSIAESIEVGTSFSDGFAIFPEHVDDCNSVGQRYSGPVVLITDALCYSTTDIFAAGFQDHAIGPILGTSGNTGAGGANVWNHEDLVRLLGGPRSPLRPLPRQTSMRVSIRRTTRVGERSGDPLEDLGVVPDAIHRMTRRDVLEQNEDLIAAAAQLLAGRPARALSFERSGPSNGSVQLTFSTRALDRVDVYVDGRPRGTLDVTDGDHTVTVPRGGSIEVRGFDAGELAALRRAGL